MVWFEHTGGKEQERGSLESGRTKSIVSDFRAAVLVVQKNCPSVQRSSDLQTSRSLRQDSSRAPLAGSWSGFPILDSFVREDRCQDTRTVLHKLIYLALHTALLTAGSQDTERPHDDGIRGNKDGQLSQPARAPMGLLDRWPQAGGRAACSM